MRPRALCPLDAIPPGGSRGFDAVEGHVTGLFAVREGETVRVYVNACPHLGVPLDWSPDQFLTADGARIVCATHGAEFRIADGLCLRGPCKGKSLQSIGVSVEDGVIMVSEPAPA
jgi:nitrite reductase/ring-hydroxylating ferredoxin subunit